MSAPMNVDLILFALAFVAIIFAIVIRKPKGRGSSGEVEGLVDGSHLNDGTAHDAHSGSHGDCGFHGDCGHH
jgi:hypothetical protein